MLYIPVSGALQADARIEPPPVPLMPARDALIYKAKKDSSRTLSDRVRTNPILPPSLPHGGRLDPCSVQARSEVIEREAKSSHRSRRRLRRNREGETAGARDRAEQRGPHAGSAWPRE